MLEGGAGRRRDLLAADGGPGSEHLRVANPGGRAVIAYVEVSLTSQTATYSLTVSQR